MRIGLLAILFLAFGTTFCQVPTKAWLDGKYDQPWYSFEIVSEGIYRITYDDFVSYGFDMNQLIAANIQIFREGQEIAIYTSTPGLLIPGDYIEFYGSGENGKFDKYLYQDTTHLHNTFKSAYNDTAVYFLTVDDKTNHLRVSSQNNNLTDLPTQEPFVYRTAETILTNSFHSGITKKISNTSYRMSDYTEGEGFYGSTVLGSSNYSLITSHRIDTDTDSALLEYQIIGDNDKSTTENDHHFRVAIGSHSEEGLVKGYGRFDGFTWISNNIITDGISNITLTNIRDLYDESRLAPAFFRITFASDAEVDFRSEYEFSLRPENRERYVVIEEFRDNDESVYVYELGANYRMQALPNGDAFEMKLPASSTAENFRHFYMYNEASTKSVLNFQSRNAVNYGDVANQGDFIIVLDEDLVAQDSSWLLDYLDHRQAEYSPIVINTKELEMHYAFGRKLHPLSLVNLIDEAYDDWFYDVRFVLLVGLSIPYDSRNNAMQYSKIPSFGNRPSDILLSCDVGQIVPKIPLGRISAVTAQEAKDYFDKVIEHEQNLNAYPNTKAGKEWTKQVIHLGGGTNAAEQGAFKSYLEQYEDIIEGPSYGGNVHTFLKTSSDPIQTALSETFDTLVSNGISLLTFFGHSSATTLEFSVYNPENYENQGRYPFVISNGCFAGDIHRIGTSAGKKFVFLKDQGAIGFLASTYFSYADQDHVYSSEFYRQMGATNYGSSVGDMMKETIIKINNGSSDELIRYTSQLITLHGDPAVKLNSHQLPDYLIEEDDVYFDPVDVSVEQDSFDLVVMPTNIGRAVEDSFLIRVRRTFPDGGISLVYSRMHQATYYKDTFILRLATVPERALGLNQFEITIDPTDIDPSLQIEETDDQVNNSLIKNLLILSDDIVPVYPYDFSVVNESTIRLAASTINLFAQERNYRIELDTLKAFDSPFKKTFLHTSIGGVIEQNIEGSTLENGKTYYWRTSVDTSSAASFKWYSSSFKYHKGYSRGWQQDHFDQYQENEMVNIGIDDNQPFEFVDDLKDISLLTYNIYAQPTGFFRGDDIGYSLNGQHLGRLRCFTQGVSSFKSGITVVVFDSATVEPKEIEMGSFGSLNCQNFRPIPLVEFADSQLNDPAVTATLRNNIYQYLDGVSQGDYVLMYLISGVGSVPKNYPDSLKNLIDGFGGTAFSNLPSGRAWALFFKKGDPGFTPIQSVGTDDSSLVTLNATIAANWTTGSMATPIIGPSYRWDSLLLKQHTLDDALLDTFSIDVIGVTKDGVEQLLMDNVSSDTVLSSVNARDYPYLKLRWNVKDDSLRTPAQLDHWRLVFEDVPELALAPNSYYEFHSDTLAEGEDISFSIAVRNPSELDFDSVRVHYSLIDGQNRTNTIEEVLIDSLRAKDSLTFEFKYSTLGWARSNRLVVNVNPGMDQYEGQFFNNIAVVPFYVSADLSNPLLDVTFDGVHIIDGDYVAASPYILIRLKDENQFVAMDDTALIDMFLEDPDGNIRQLNFTQSDIDFIPPADLANNVAEIQYTPNFSEEGTYKIRIQGRDKSGNASGYFNYSVSFRVSKESTITRVFNYPNPFTTSTRFVFELTGEKVPDNFRIDIMNIKGKVIRQLDISDFQDLHIGRNITEFAWDGTDEYGAEVGNGVYLYRVYASLNGEELELNDTNQEQYFQSGIGKMTIIR